MLNELLERYPALKCIENDISSAADMLISGFRGGNKLLLCGNGGSCADCEHIVGELMKGFLVLRPLTDGQKKQMKENCPDINDGYLSKLQRAVPAISLPSFTALNTAFCNDVDPELVFAQSLMGLGNQNDMLICINYRQ